MPDKFGWPTLPAGARWLNEDEAAGKTPPEQIVSPEDIQSNVGSVLRQVMGPPKPEGAAPRFFQDVVEPTAYKATAIPRAIIKNLAETATDPTQLGLALASTILTGPMAPGVKALGAVAPEAADALSSLGATGLRRVLGIGAAGAGIAGAQGQNPVTGGGQAALTQLIGGEGARKLSQFAGMSYQAAKLAREDPEALGQIVSGVIQSLPSMRTPADFFAAFKKGAAQRAISQEYQAARNGIVSELGGQSFQSPTMQLMRGDPALAVSGQIPGVSPQNPQASFTALGSGKGAYGIDDMLETMKRLRTVGYTQDEARSGLAAMTARDRAGQIESELTPQVTADQMSKITDMNSKYSRGQRIIDLFDDPKLLKKGKEELNIPALQEKYLKMGYKTGDSYALAADAANLEAQLFRGGPLAQDIPGAPGKFFGHAGVSGRGHGFLSFLPKPPTLTQYAGQENTGLSPFSSSILSQMFRQGVNNKPNTLRDEEKP